MGSYAHFSLRRNHQLVGSGFFRNPIQQLAAPALAERMVTEGFPEKATVWVVNLDCWGDGYTAGVAARAEPARKAATLKPHWRS